MSPTVVIIGLLIKTTLVLGVLVWWNRYNTREHRENRKRLAEEAKTLKRIEDEKKQAERTAVERLVQVIETTARRGEWSKRKLTWQHDLSTNEYGLANIELCDESWTPTSRYQPYRPKHVVLFTQEQVNRIEIALTGKSVTEEHEVADQMIDALSDLEMKSEMALLDLQSWTDNP